MAEYIVEFDKTQYDEAVADGILKNTDDPTLYGMPILGKIIRCRECIYWKDEDFCNNPQWHLDHKFLRPCTEPNGFCAWAERSE